MGVATAAWHVRLFSSFAVLKVIDDDMLTPLMMYYSKALYNISTCTFQHSADLRNIDYGLAVNNECIFSASQMEMINVISFIPLTVIANITVMALVKCKF